MTEADERFWSMLAHLSVLLNAVTGFLGVVVSFVIFLAYKDRSEKVAFQALQSTFFQLIFVIGAGAIAAVSWFGTAFLSAFVIGLLCVPFAGIISLIPIGAMIYGVIGGIQVYQGADFRYALVAEWADSAAD